MSSVEKVTRCATRLEIVEASAAELRGFRVIHADAIALEPRPDGGAVVCRAPDGSEARIEYARVCVCAGAVPRLVVRDPLASRHVLGIRDVASVRSRARAPCARAVLRH